MRVRRAFIARLGLALLTLVSFTFSGRAVAQAGWAVEKTFHIGGEGGWDYVTLDAKIHRICIYRAIPCPKSAMAEIAIAREIPTNPVCSLYKRVNYTFPFFHNTVTQ
jgi:hypothetical protein